MKITSWLKLITLTFTSANDIELDDTNLYNSIQSGTWFVKYYSDSCKWCKKLAPVWEEVSTDLTQWSQENNFHFASFSCSKYQDLCRKFQIEGYPTLYVYKDGKYIDEYYGARTNKDLQDYVKEQAQKLNAIPETEAETANDNAVVQEGALQVEEPEAIPNPEGKTIEFTAENFKESVASGPWFINFYATRCVKCKNLAPEWEKLGQELKGQINVGSLNCDEPDKKQLCLDYKIQGYPSLLFIRDGSFKENYISENLQKLKEAALEGLAPPKTFHLNDITTRQANNELFFVYYSPDNSFLKANPQTRGAITNLSLRVPVYFTNDNKVVSHYSIDSKPTLLVIKDKNKEVYQGDLTKSDDILDWIKKNQHPLVRAITQGNMEEAFTKDDKDVLMVVYDSKDDKQSSQVKNFEDIAQKLIKNNPEQFSHFLFAKYDSYRMKDQLKDYYGVHTSVLPIVLYLKYNESTYYDIDAEEKYVPIEEMAIVQFVTEADKGQLVINTKSFGNDIKRMLRSSYYEWSSFYHNYPYYTIGVPAALIGLIVLAASMSNGYSGYQRVETKKSR